MGGRWDWDGGVGWGGVGVDVSPEPGGGLTKTTPPRRQFTPRPDGLSQFLSAPFFPTFAPQRPSVPFIFDFNTHTGTHALTMQQGLVVRQ